MTSDYHERSRLMSARVVFASLGILVGGALAPVLVTGFGDGRQGYAAMSWVLATIIGVSMAACFFGPVFSFAIVYTLIAGGIH